MGPFEASGISYEVRSCTNKSNGKTRNVKVLRKSEMNKQEQNQFNNRIQTERAISNHNTGILNIYGMTED